MFPALESAPGWVIAGSVPEVWQPLPNPYGNGFVPLLSDGAVSGPFDQPPRYGPPQGYR